MMHRWYVKDRIMCILVWVEHLVSSKIQDLHARRFPSFGAFPTRCRVDTDDSHIVLSILVSQVDRTLPFDRSLLFGLILKLHFGRFTPTHTAHDLTCFFSSEILWAPILKRNWQRSAGDNSLDLKVSYPMINASELAPLGSSS